MDTVTQLGEAEDVAAPPADPPRDPAREVPRWPLPVTVLATLVAVALGAWQLGDTSFWFDEGSSIGLVDRPYGDFLWRLSHWEVNQAPYFLLLSGWHRLGDSEAFLRSLSALFFVATVPMVFALGRRLFDARVGAVAALLVAIHPLALEWGQQLRAYSLVLFLVTAATYLLVRAVEEPGDRRALAFAAVAALATYAHFYAGLVLATQLASLLLLRPVPRRLALVAGSVSAVLLVPLALFFVTREGDPLYWLGDDESTGELLVGTLQGIAGGGTAQLLAYLLGVVLGGWAVARVVRAAGRAPESWRHLLPVLCLLAPLLAVTVATLTVKPLLEPRFMIVVIPGLVLLAALGLCRLPSRSLAAAGLAALLAVSGFGVGDWYSSEPFEDWRGATAKVAARAEPGDTLVVVPSRGVHTVRYYLDRLDGADPEIEFPAAGEPPAGLRLFVIERRDAAVVGSPLATFPQWRDEHYVQVEDEFFTNLVVRIYIHTPVR